MDVRMDARNVKNGLRRLLQHLSVKMPATGWFFARRPPGDAIVPSNKTWTCMFSYMRRVASGEPVCFSVHNTGCSGASCYLGFKRPSKNAGAFLAEKERFKKDQGLGDAFYKTICAAPATAEFLIWNAVEKIDDDQDIEVVNLWVDAVNLGGLVTLSNYDRADNDGVRLPFASGCQSIWTLPFKETFLEGPKAIAGCMDPAMRKYLPPDVVSFSVTATRFVEMAENISGSFLQGTSWNSLMKGV